MEFNFEEGEVLLFDKPLEWTSFDVVKKVRNTIRIKKVGHAGTLDPLATGLLIVCTGKKTKSIDSLMGMEKEYTGTICLGAITPSLDRETDITETAPFENITLKECEQAAQRFIGETDQIPPIFSALKVDGKRLYKSAREGKEVEIESRKINISSFEITKFELPFVSFRVTCSKGTYIRSLARDFAKEVNTLGYLTALCRTKIGEYKVEDALNLTEFVTQINALKTL